MTCLVSRGIFLILILVSASIIALSDSPFYIAGGSDFTAEIIAPPLTGQIMAFLAICLAAFAAIFARRRGWRMLGWLGGAMLLLLATHRIDIDPGRGRITDHWLALTVQSLPINPNDGLAADGTKLLHFWFYDEATPRQGPTLIILKGPFPLTLDMGPLQQAWN